MLEPKNSVHARVQHFADTLLLQRTKEENHLAAARRGVEVKQQPPHGRKHKNPEKVVFVFRPQQRAPPTVGQLAWIITAAAFAVAPHPRHQVFFRKLQRTEPAATATTAAVTIATASCTLMVVTAGAVAAAAAGAAISAARGRTRPTAKHQGVRAKSWRHQGPSVSWWCWRWLGVFRSVGSRTQVSKHLREVVEARRLRRHSLTGQPCTKSQSAAINLSSTTSKLFVTSAWQLTILPYRKV